MSLSSASASRVKRRGSGPVIVSIAVHAGIAALLVPALMVPRHLERIFGTRPEHEGLRERIVFVAAPPRHANAVIDEIATGIRTQSPAGRVTDPPRVGSVEPVIAPADTASAGMGGIAGGDPTDPGGVVLVPNSADPRIWNARAAYAPRTPSRAEMLEGSLGRAIASANDSIAALGVQNVRPDWVVGREGRQFGIARDRIHLGPVELPAVAMGLAPIAGFGCMPKMFFPDRPVRDSVGIICMRLENSVLAERAERIDEMSAEIRARALLASASREELARIAARKDRERAARLRAEPGAARPTPPSH